MTYDKIKERKLLLCRFIREEADIYNMGKELGLGSVDKYDKAYELHQKRGTYFYIPSGEKDKIIEDIASSTSDSKLVEIFARLRPRDWLGVGFRGRFYTYEEGKGLVIGNSWDDVKQDVLEALNQVGERGYAFLKAIVELYEDGKWSGDWYGVAYSDILARMRRICGKPILPAPRDFPILKSYRIYYKSGSRKYPTHSIPEETIPAIKEALEEWRKKFRKL